MATPQNKSKKPVLKTTVTRKDANNHSWSGQIVKDKITMRVEVNSISNLLARCEASRGLESIADYLLTK